MNTLTAKRIERGLSQARIAKNAGTTTIGYQRYEYETREPKVTTAINIAIALGVKTLEEFYELWSRQSTTENETV